MDYQFQQHYSPREVTEFSLFNSTPFVSRHGNKILQFLLLERREVVGVIHFAVDNNSASSPLRATYGGFEFLKDLPSAVVRDFITWVVHEMVKKKFNEIKIGLQPEFYSPTINDFIRDILQDCDFDHLEDTGQVVECKHRNFRQVINRFEKNRMDRCLKDSFVSRQGKGSLPLDIFNMIAQSRIEKQLPVTLEYREIKKNFQKFPDCFFWFGVWKEAELAAAAIGIRVKPDTMYYFFPGHDSKFNSWSPLVLLLNEMYMLCIRENIKYLDLGKSSCDGIINTGLFQFKKNLGGVTYKQSQFRWTAHYL